MAKEFNSYKNNHLNINRKPFIVVCGCPRSGTYLLCSLLESKLDILFPIESYFIPLFQRYLFLWGDLKCKSNRFHLIAAIRRFVYIWVYFGIRSKQPDKQAEISILSVLDDNIHEIEAGENYSEILDIIFSSFASKRGYSYWGDKSANYSPVSLARLSEALPNLRVIHIIRDGRDVSQSWCKEWFGPNSLAEAAELWKQHINSYREWGQSCDSESYFEVKYEELIESPDEVLKRISEFLSISDVSSKSISKNNLSNVLKNEKTHLHIGSQLDPTNKDKWKKQFNRTQITLFEYIAGDTLKDLGYNISGITPSIIDRIAINFNIVIASIANVVSWNYFARLFRSKLPVILRFIPRRYL